MDSTKIYGGLAGIAICFGFIVFAIWQERVRKKLADTGFSEINPRDYDAFKEVDYSSWFIAHREVKFSKLFSNGEDSFGKHFIYDHHKKLISTIGHKNRAVSTIRAGERWIASDFEQSFWVRVKTLYFYEFPGNTPVFTYSPLSKLEFFTIDHTFLVSGSTYRITSKKLLGGYRCDFYRDGSFLGTIASVSVKQLPIAVVQGSIDPLALGMIFNLFLRHANY